MSDASRVLICNSPYDQGGIGQHFAQLVEESRGRGELHRYISPGIRDNDPAGIQLHNRSYGLFRFTPLRFLPSWKSHVGNALYDLRASRKLPQGDKLTGFVGKSLFCFKRARQIGYSYLELIAANSHVQQVQHLHADAARITGIRDTWLNSAQMRRTLKEYEMADVIYVHSEYVRQSFIEAGVSPDRLRRMVLQIRPRFKPPESRPSDPVFRVVYVGRLDATKGLPLLIEAFRALDLPQKELNLIGGWSTPQMRRYLKPIVSEDPQIKIAPGDPLPALHRADAFVHPTFEDGFGYAPAEALACGVPVVVTDQTGMQEYVRTGQNGYVVPYGSVSALVDRMMDCKDHIPPQTRSLLPTEACPSTSVAEAFTADV